MEAVLVAAFFVSPFAAIGAWLRRRDRLRLALLLGVLALVGAWLLLLGVALTGYRDMDGAVDCVPCTPLQTTVRYAAWLLPTAAMLAAAASLGSLLVPSRR